jgi:hypothetical protein
MILYTHVILLFAFWSVPPWSPDNQYASCIPMCIFLVLYGIRCSTMCPISIILGTIATPLCFMSSCGSCHLWLYCTRHCHINALFALFHSWSFTCLCFFPVVNICVQMSITLNEFRYVTKCLASPMASFRYVWPLLVSQLPNGILMKTFIATIGDMYAFRSLKKGSFRFCCTLYVPCSVWYEFETRLVSANVIGFMFDMVILE